MHITQYLNTVIATVLLLFLGVGCEVEEEDNELLLMMEEGELGGSQEDQGESEMTEDSPRYAVQMLTLVNRFRSQGGECGGEQLSSVPQLSLNEILNQSSLLHAQDMAENEYFDHTSLDGRSAWDRMEALGYRGNAYGENIAAGHSTVRETFEQWKSSPGHCLNMLSPQFTELGVGHYVYQDSLYTHYWVQNFGRP